MTTTIAVAGKGGVGKTLTAALLIRYMVDRQLGSVLAVDADPSTNLHLALGTTVRGTIGDMREDMLALTQARSMPAGVSLNEYLDDQLRTLLSEAKDLDLLAMGRPEEPGCYCAVNNLLRFLVDHIIERYDFVVIDNEAGMEHLSRRTTRDVELLLLVSDPTVRGVLIAAEMQTLVRKLKIHVRRTLAIINRVPSHNGDVSMNDLPPSVRAAIAARGLEVIGLVPCDENVTEYDAQGKPFFELPADSPARPAVWAIGAALDELQPRVAVGR